MSAAEYAGLVGKYVDMRRDPTDEVEWAELRASHGGELPENPAVGFAGTVVAVQDSLLVGGWAVEVIMDYGMSHAIFPGDEWRFTVCVDEATWKDMRLG
jgi:hypothetical protein